MGHGKNLEGIVRNQKALRKNGGAVTDVGHGETCGAWSEMEKHYQKLEDPIRNRLVKDVGRTQSG